MVSIPTLDEMSKLEKKTKSVAEATICSKCNSFILVPNSSYELFGLSERRDPKGKSVGCSVVYPKEPPSILHSIVDWTRYYPLKDGWTFSASFDKGNLILKEKEQHICNKIDLS